MVTPALCRLVAVAVLATAVGCASSGSTTGSAAPATVAAPGAPSTTGTVGAPVPPGVEPERLVAGRPYDQAPVATVTLVDPTRPTAAGVGTPARPDRTLEVTVHRPEGPGPFPLVVFAHGLSGHPDRFTVLFSAWARAGYLVVAPALPLTNDTVDGSAGNWVDVAHQPGDLSFVLDQVLAGTTDPDSEWFGLVDPERVGVAGLSLGGATTYALAFNPCCTDPRPDAAMVLAGALFPIGEPYVLDGRIPLLVMHGTDDASFPYDSAVAAVAGAADPVWFVTMVGGSHVGPFEDVDTPHHAITERVSVDFWDATLLGLDAAGARLEVDADVPGVSRLDRAP